MSSPDQSYVKIATTGGNGYLPLEFVHYEDVHYSPINFETLHQNVVVFKIYTIAKKRANILGVW